MPFTNHNKITIGTFLPTQRAQKSSFTLIVQYPGTTPVQYFPKDVARTIGEDEDLDVHKSHKAGLCPHTLWNP